MPQLSSFATTASNVATNAVTRTITISNEVVEIDGVIDPPTGHDNWGSWTIICESSGGLRFTSGASGTMGGGTHAPLTIIEKTNGHRFGTDNWKSGAGNPGPGTSARFTGDGTNVAKFHFVNWIVETGDRSDFDIARGNASGGTGASGPKVEFSGLSLYQQTQAGQTAHFNHYSGQCIITPHPQLGFGWFISNGTNGHALQISTPIAGDGKIDGLVIDDLTATNNNTENGVASARVAVALEAVPQNGELVLSNLNTPNITDENGGTNASTKSLVLIDPVGLPTIGPNWDREVNIEVRRTVPFEFSGVDVPANTTLYAEATATNGVDTTGTASGGAGSVVVRTQWSVPRLPGAPNTKNLTWANTNTYKFYMVGLPFQKFAISTARTIANSPATIGGSDGLLTPDVFPNGDALTAMSTGTVSTIDQLYRALKTYGVANRLEPSADVSLVKLDSNGNIVLGSGATLQFSTIQSPLVAENSNLFTVKVSATGLIGPGKGINSLNLGSGNTADASVVSRMGVPYTDSTGTSSLLTITAPTNSRVSVFKNDGTRLGTNNSWTSPWNLVVSAANSLANTRIGYVGTDKLREVSSVDLDISAGGSYSHTFAEGRQVNDPLGTEILSGVTAKQGLQVSIAASGTNVGRATILVPDSSTKVKEALKGVFDAITTADGARFAAFERQLPAVTDLDGQSANLFLGPDCQLRAGLSVNTESGISGFVFGGIGGAPQVSNGNARVYYIPEISGVGGGSGGGFTDADRTNLGAIKTVTDGLDVPTTAENATAVWGAGTRTLTTATGGFTSSDRSNLNAIKSVADSLDIPTESEIASEVWTANSRTLTSAADFTAADRTNLGAIKTVTDALDVPTAAENATSVWGATTRTLSAGDFTATDRTNLGSIKTTVEALPTSAFTATDRTNLGSIKTDVEALPTSAFTATDRSNLGAIKTVTDGLDVPTAAENATSVWGAGTRTLTSGVGLTATQATQLSNASTKATQNNNVLTNGTYGLAAMKTAQDMIPTTSGGGGGGPTALYSYQPALYSPPISVTAIDTTNDTLTIDGDDYDDLTTGDDIRFINGGGYTYRPNLSGFIIPTDSSFNNTTHTIGKVDDTNHKIKLYRDSTDAIANQYPTSLTGSGNIGNLVVTGVNPQADTESGAPANFTTPAWEVSNLSSHYLKFDGGYHCFLFAHAGDSSSGSNLAEAASVVKLEVSYETSATGAFDEWFDVSDDTWEVTVRSASRNITVAGIKMNAFTAFYKLTELSSIDSGGITDGKFVKFRMYYSEDNATNGSGASASVSNIVNAYLNMTVLPSLTVSGGASSGGLNQQQSTWLSNVNTAVTSSTHGNSALKTAIDGVPAGVWNRDLSGTQTTDSAGDLIKDASVASGATAAQLWGYSVPSSPTAGTASAFLKTARDDATAAKNDLANSTDGLGALKSAIDTIDSEVGTIDTNLDSVKTTVEALPTSAGFTSTDRSNLGAVKTVTDGLDIPTESEITTAVWGASTRTLTASGGFTSTDRTNLGSVKSAIENSTTGLSAIKTAVNTVDAVVDDIKSTVDSDIPSVSDIWNTGLSTTTATYGTLTPTGVNGAMTLSESQYDALPSTPIPMTFDNTGGYTNLDTGRTYYGVKTQVNNNSWFLTIYDTLELAEAGDSASTRQPSGPGTPTDIVVRYQTSSTTTHHGSAQSIIVETQADTNTVQSEVQNSTYGLDALHTDIGNISAGGATAQQIWEYDTSSVTGSKAGATLNTAATDATAAKNDLANATDGLGALKTAIEGIETGGGGGGGFTSTDRTNLGAIKTVTDALDVPTEAENAAAVWAASTRTLTADAAPTVSEIWGTDLTSSSTITLSPTSVTSDVMLISDADNTAFGTGVRAVGFESVSTYGTVNTTATYYAKVFSTGGVHFLPIYDTESNAETNDLSTGLVRLTGSGTAADVELEYTGTVNHGSARSIISETRGDVNTVQSEVQNSTYGLDALHTDIGNISGGGGGGFTSTDRTNLGAIKTVTDALDVPTETEIATAVWGATTKEITGGAPSASSIADAVWDENLSGTASAGTAAALIKSASTSGFDSTDRTNLGSIKTSVEALPTDAAPSAEAIATEVLNATIHEGQRDAVTITPIAGGGAAFTLAHSDRNDIRNGDRIDITQADTFNLPNDHYFAYIGYDDLFLYTDQDDAKIGKATGYVTNLGTGTVANVRLTRPADSGFITVKAAVDALLSNTDSAIHNIDEVLDNLTNLLGSSFVENNIGLQKSLRIVLAILAGRSTVSPNGKTFTWHRVGDDTAIVQGNASDSGRTVPEIDP